MARSRLVDQVDRFVGQEAVGDVAVRQRRGGDNRRVGDAHAVVDLVFLFQPAQDRDRVLDRGRGDKHRLEAPRQRSILLDVLAVLVERGRANAVQLAARERRLEQVGGVHRAVGFAGANQCMHLIDEQDDAAGGGRHFVEHALQPLLEVAAIFRAGDQRAEVERQELLALERFGHVAVDDAQRQSFDDRRLADAGLADQDRVVLGAPRQNLHGAANFLVAPDDRIELARARGFGEVAGVFLQRFVRVLGARRIGGATFAQILDRRIERLRRHAGVGENASRRAVLVEC